MTDFKPLLYQFYLQIAFCNAFTLLDSSPAHIKGQVGDLRLIAPEFFVAVPLVLERIQKEIYRKLNTVSPIAAPIFTYLMDYKIRWTQRGFDTPIINRLVSKRIRDQFGGRLKLMVVSSAPLNARTQALIQAALDCKVVIAYGESLFYVIIDFNLNIYYGQHQDPLK